MTNKITTLGKEISEQFPQIIDSHFKQYKISLNTVSEISKFCQIMKNNVDKCSESIVKTQPNLNQNYDKLEEKVQNLSSKVESLKVVNQSAFCTIDNQAKTIYGLKTKLTQFKHEF